MSSTFQDVADEYGIDTATKNYALQGKARVRRKNAIKEACVPPHVLDAVGFTDPCSSYHPENAREYPTTKECTSEKEASSDEASTNSSSTMTSEDSESVRVHLHQDVREDMDDSFGDFGAVSEDADDVVWTVVDLTDGTVTLTVVGEWSRRRNVEYSEFADNYEPITVENGVPRFGY